MRMSAIFKSGMLLLTLVLLGSFSNVKCDAKIDYSKLSKCEVMNTPISDLADLPFEELIKVSDNFTY
jgi:hypothetical protein